MDTFNANILVIVFTLTFSADSMKMNLMETDAVLSCTNIYFKPKHMNMIYYVNRVKTFTNWPRQLIQTPKALSKSGFFYENVGDRVTCFYCGVILKNWLKNDCIDTEHLRWSPDCSFAKMVSSMDGFSELTSN
ncbi:hypothetical protein KUTeg_002857 [Tegillarca granosa]|uniref:Uncharacterized protein n=1 Tax=Tegillarca granosa TaxID=220873 RepID=A0ABQ9FQK6_TEGGR|nr:hypothetical protein KUTeg_002857 [Tegillarca granosa]